MPSASCRIPTSERADVAERADRARVRRQLDERDVAGIEQHAGDEVESLLRAGRHDDSLGRRELIDRARISSMTASRKRRVAARRPVLQHRTVRAVEQAARDLAEGLPREDVFGRIPWRERDHVFRAREHRAHLPDRGLAHEAGGLREELVVIGHALIRTGGSIDRSAELAKRRYCVW